MLVETFGSDGRQVQITSVKCVIKRKQWPLKPNQIKTIRSNESSRNPHKFHVKLFYRWPGDRRLHHHGHCLEWRMFIRRMRRTSHQLTPPSTPPPPPPHLAIMPPFSGQWAHNRKNQLHPKIKRAQIETFTMTTGNIFITYLSPQFLLEIGFFVFF